MLAGLAPSILANDARAVQLMGKVAECKAPQRLVITWVRPSNFKDESKHSRVTFKTTPFDGMVRLTVTHDKLAEGSSMALATAKNWPLVLSSMKSFLECGQSMNGFALALGAKESFGCYRS